MVRSLFIYVSQSLKDEKLYSYFRYLTGWVKYYLITAHFAFQYFVKETCWSKLEIFLGQDARQDAHINYWNWYFMISFCSSILDGAAKGTCWHFIIIIGNNFLKLKNRIIKILNDLCNLQQESCLILKRVIIFKNSKNSHKKQYNISFYLIETRI